MERKTIGVTLRERKTVEWLREQTGAADIIIDVKMVKKMDMRRPCDEKAR